MPKLLSYHDKELPNSVLENLIALRPDKNARYSKRDDIAQATLFADIFRDILRYNTTAKSWYVYDGARWMIDNEGMKAKGLAQTLARAMLLYAATLDGDESFLKFAAGLQSQNKRKTMLEDAKPHIYVAGEDFDTQPYLLNCQNCILDLRTFQPMEHDSSLLLSKVASVTYNPDAKSKVFETFLHDIMCGDREKIEYIQKIFGYALTGGTEREELYLFYGSTTRNGKSTLCDTLETLFGDYSANIMPETLAQKSKDSRAASGDIARLNGVRYLHCGEPPKRMIFDVALVKSLTGHDVITARHLYERELQFTAIFKLIINTNYLPLVGDDTLFSSNRVKVVTFDRHFSDEEQDVHLKQKLKTPEALSAVLNWCLEGLRKYREEGENLTPPASVKAATGAYREKSDKLANFIAECLEPNERGVIQVKRLYEYYSAWCKTYGFGVENKGNFVDELKTKGLFAASGTIAGVTVRNVVKGFAVSPDAPSLFSPSSSPPAHTDADAPPF